MRGADAVSVLRDLYGGPLALGRGGDQPGYHAGFPDIARMSADNYEGHSVI